LFFLLSSQICRKPSSNFKSGVVRMRLCECGEPATWIDEEGKVLCGDCYLSMVESWTPIDLIECDEDIDEEDLEEEVQMQLE
jgi:hypothetical protein